MKFCIVTLARLNNGDVNNLISNLNTFFIKNNKNIDLLIFIEKKDESYISNIIKYDGGNLYIHKLENFTEYNNIKGDVSDKVFGVNISYRMMCRFFAGEIFKILKFYDYTHYLRLDTDSRFYNTIRDLFSEFILNDSSYGYITIINEPRQLTVLFDYELRKFITNNSINVNQYILRDHLSHMNFCYYNNFEMVKISDFTSDVHLKLYEYLDSECNGFLKYRWGDHLYRYAYVNLFLNQEKIHYFADIDYIHTFNLKNKPFKFVDWNLV
jgi:hypothetical protein